MSKFASDIRIHAIDISNQQWNRHLDWNISVISVFSDMFKLYYATRLDTDKANLEYQTKDIMWDINLFENARAILGAMSGSAATSSGNEPSQLESALGGAMGGASAGYMVGGPIGAAIGGILGAASSFL